MGYRTAGVRGTAALLVAAKLAIAAPSFGAEPLAWEFEVLLDDKAIGYHTFSVSGEGERQILRTEASFDVKFLFVTAFRYRHRNTEVWRDGCLAEIDAVTESNGRVLEVTGAQTGNRFAVASPSGTETLADCVRSFAYWNPEILGAERLLNSQTGEYEPVTVRFEGEDSVRVGDELVGARRYRLEADAGDITLWYSDDEVRRWLALEAPAKGGRRIRYVPVSVPAADGGMRLARGD